MYVYFINNCLAFNSTAFLHMNYEYFDIRYLAFNATSNLSAYELQIFLLIVI